jgi:hypothetical protein
MTFNSLQLALDYLERHFFTRYLFPVKKGAKFPPCLKDNLDGNCSNDPAQIREWAKMFPGCNWGVAHFKSKLLVADIDTNPAKGKKGQETFDELEMLYGWPDTEKTTTPSGGFHMVYEGWEADGPTGHPAHIMALGKNGLGMDVDSPNYTLIPGCTFADGTSYVGNDADAVKCPEWIYTVIKSSKASARISNAGEIAVDLDKPENIALAIDFLQEDAEPAIEGRGGDFTTYKTACYLKDIGISPELAVDLLNEYYNPRCEPQWDSDGLERKVASAYAYSNLSKVGGKTAEADFADDPPSDDFETPGTWNPETKRNEKAAPTALVEQALDRTATIEREKAKPENAPGATVRPKKIPEIIDNYVWVVGMDRWFDKRDPRGDNNERIIWNDKQFDSEYNKKVCPERGSAADRLRRMKKGGPASYYRVGFKPGQPQVVDFGETYNVYRKPDIGPVEGDVTWWTEHLEYLLPDDVSRNHLLNWMAWLLQNLDKKPKHALILQGEVNGTGKSFIADVLTRILHPGNVSIVPQNGLSGRFNAWALQCKLIVVEELRASDKGAVKEALHDIITQEVISIEKKGVDPMKVENCFGIFCLTNDDAALTLDNTDRRYLVIRTDRTKEEARAKADAGYFVRLFAKLKDDAAMSAVAYSLMNRDITGYNGQAAAPDTDAKAAMQAASADDLEVWLDDSRGNWPLSAPLIQLDDIIVNLPRRLDRPGLMRRLKGILMRKHKAQDMGQHRLPDGKRVKLYALGGKGAILINQMDVLGAIYADAKAKAGGGVQEDDSAGSDFEGVGD